MRKKKIWYGLLACFALYLCYLLYIFVLSPKTNLQSIYLIPKDAVFIIESDQPIKSWERISKSEAWPHLNKNETFSNLTENIQKFDTLFTNNQRLLERFDGRSLFISIHAISKKDYGIFYVLDLKRFAKLQLLKTYLNTLLNNNYTLSKRTYHQHEILEAYDNRTKETLYLAFIKNQLIASFTHALVEASIDQYGEPTLGRNLNFLEITKKVGHEDLFRVYLQYDFLDEYYELFSNAPAERVKALSKDFLFSGFSFMVDASSTVTANGYTNIRNENESYLVAVQKSGKSQRTIPKIAPKNTALYIGYGFDSFKEFYKNFEAVQQANDSEAFQEYQEGIEKVEKFLKIDIEEHFMDWIGDEIALLQIQSQLVKGKNELALVLKTSDLDDARSNLGFILGQIKKKTPVKFKAVDYKGHSINFLSIKGFFKLLLGKRFEAFDKPYFTLIEDYVVFSDNPNTLKSMIDGVVENKTLATESDFQDFSKRFDDESSVFAYVNLPILYHNLYDLADATTKRQLRQNKDFIICFPQVGLHLSPEEDLFESRFIVDYQAVDEVMKNALFQGISLSVSKKGNEKTELTIDNAFALRPIYPTDLNANSFQKKYRSGALWFTVELKDGHKHGKYEQFYPNGIKKMTGRFKKDEQVGTWRYFDPEGELVFKKRF